MGFLKHIGHSISHGLKSTVKAVEHNPVSHALSEAYHVVETPLVHNPLSREIGKGWRAVERPVNKGLAKGIKAVTGHNVLGSHPLTTIGSAVGAYFTAGAAGALMGGASLSGAASAGISGLESAAGSAVGGIGSGLSAVGANSLGGVVSGWGTALDAAATSAMASSGSIAGQMGLSGLNATEMNVGSGLTHAGQAVGNNIIGKGLSAVGDKLTGAISDELAGGTGHALGSFGFDKSGSLVQGTLKEVASVTDNFHNTGVFSKGLKNALIKQGMQAATSSGKGDATTGTGTQQGSGGFNQSDPVDALVKGGNIGYMDLGNASFGNILSTKEPNYSVDALQQAPTTTSELLGATSGPVQLTAF